MSNFYVETNRIETPETSTHRSYPEPENYLKIEVTDPITHLSSGNKFTDYQVTTKTNIPYFKFHESCVRRRYSDFLWLKEKLESFLKIKLSGFPSKKILKQLPFGSKDGIFEIDLIEGRRSKLESFMNNIAQNPNIKVLKIFHMFLQSIIMDKECDDSTVLT